MSRRPVAPPAPSEPDVKPGDLICSNCGTGNDPARRFCRRCGNSLLTAVVARRPPWYRRIFGRQRALAAGERPSHMGRAGSKRRAISLPRVLLMLVALGVIAALVGYVLVPDVRQRVDSAVGDVRRMFDTFSNPGTQALDDDIATYWLADPSGETPSVNVNFGDTINLVSVTFHSGAGTGDDFSRYGRPRTVEFRFPGGGSPVRVVLRDDPAAQEHPLEVDSVRTIELRIVDFYGADADGEPLIALREVEFTSRR
jgi:hypothetical protein